MRVCVFICLAFMLPPFSFNIFFFFFGPTVAYIFVTDVLRCLSAWIQFFHSFISVPDRNCFCGCCRCSTRLGCCCCCFIFQACVQLPRRPFSWLHFLGHFVILCLFWFRYSYQLHYSYFPLKL